MESRGTASANASKLGPVSHHVCLEWLETIRRIIASIDRHRENQCVGAYLSGLCALREALEAFNAVVQDRPGIRRLSVDSLEEGGESVLSRDYAYAAVLTIASRVRSPELVRYYCELQRNRNETSFKPLVALSEALTHESVSAVASTLLNESDSYLARSVKSWIQRRAGQNDKPMPSDYLGTGLYNQACLLAANGQNREAFAKLGQCVDWFGSNGGGDTWDAALRVAETDLDFHELRLCQDRWDSFVAASLHRGYRPHRSSPSFRYLAAIAVWALPGNRWRDDVECRAAEQRIASTFDWILALPSRSKSQADPSDSTSAAISLANFCAVSVEASSVLKPDDPAALAETANAYDQMRAAKDLVVVQLDSAGCESATPNTVQMFLAQRRAEGSKWLRRILLVTCEPEHRPGWADAVFVLPPAAMSSIHAWDVDMDLDARSEERGKRLVTQLENAHSISVRPDRGDACHVVPIAAGEEFDVMARLEEAVEAVTRSRTDQLRGILASDVVKELESERKPTADAIRRLFGGTFCGKDLERLLAEPVRSMEGGG